MGNTILDWNVSHGEVELLQDMTEEFMKVWNEYKEKYVEWKKEYPKYFEERSVTEFNYKEIYAD